MSAGLAVMAPESASSDAFYLGHGAEDQEGIHDMIAVGGGGGGKFGGRFGGKKNLRAHGGGPSFADSRNADSLDADTAFWSATITTDERGEASVEFKVPNKSTRWRMTCHGVGPDTLLGETTTAMISKSDFFVELRTPVALVAGDKPQFVGRIHNLTGKQGECKLLIDLRSTKTADLQRIERTVSLGENPTVEFTFEASGVWPASDSANVSVSATFGENSTSQSEDFRVRPWGVEQVAAQGGMLDSRTVFELELPRVGQYSNKSLELFVGAGLDHLIIETALGQSSLRHAVRFPNQTDAAGDLAGVCSVMKFISESGRAGGAEYKELRSRGDSLVARLVSSQNEDGGWSWLGRNANSIPQTSSRAMVALAAARELGFSFDESQVSKGMKYLRDAFRTAAQDADEVKGMLVHALAANGEVNFGAANRLHRNRHTLSAAALAYTTLALVEMKRSPMAVDVATVLQEKARFGGATPRKCHWPVESNTSWTQSKLEMAALAATALQRALPASEAVDAGIEYLLSERPWNLRSSRGAIVEALALFAGSTQPSRDNMRIIATIDGERRELQLSQHRPGESLRIVLADESASKVRVELELQGRGRPHFLAALRGFDSDLSKLDGRGEHYSLGRYRYLAVAPVYRGLAIPIGFDVTRKAKDKHVNEVAHLPVGTRTRVELRYSIESQRRAPGTRDYSVVEVPIPAGTRVLKDTVTGRFMSFEVRNGVLSAHVSSDSRTGSLEFELIGANVGEYRTLPVKVSSTVAPERYTFFPPTKLTVLASGSKSPDEYKPTPDELFHLGKAMYESEEFEDSHAQLSALFNGYERVLDLNILRETANMLLHMSIARNDSNAIVRYFEVLKEKNPALTIAFDKVVRVAEAYRELREFERALLIYRAVVEETYGKDLKVAGTLREENEFAGATDTLERLWLEYPDFPVALQTQLALTDLILSKAPDAARDKSLRKARRDRAALTKQGILMLKRFLSMYPESPLAPEAALNLVSAYLGLEDYDSTAVLAGEMATLYKEPKFLDAFQYTRAVAKWYLGDNEEARKSLQQIAEARYPTKSGGTVPSENRDLALYILGQIHHAQRDFERATEYYERVENLFVDAREALAGFNEKQLVVEEVTTARPGTSVALPVEFKNLDEVEVLVYAVDLMTLYLREQNLSNITQVNLAGISPTVRKLVPLGKNDDLRTTEQSIDLQLDEAGAYLVICRGGDLFSSGLVLVSNLELDVKEDPQTGRMRVQVLDIASGEYVRDVDVRVVGSNDGSFQSGRTDPRGLFVADSVLGRSTVIARLGARQFAFHRGEQSLGNVPVQQERGAIELNGFGQETGDVPAYLDNVIGLNRGNFRAQQEALDSEVRKSREGVQVLQVK